MPDIFELIDAGVVEKVLGRYSASLKAPIVLLDRDEKVLLGTSGAVPEGKLIKRPLYLRDKLVAYVAAPSSARGARATVALLESNLNEIIEMGYEIESLSGEVARNYEELSLMWNISERLGAGLDVDRICNILADEVMKICPSQNLSIMLVSELPSGPQPTACIIDPGELRSQKEYKKSYFFPKVSRGDDASNASMMIMSTDSGLLGEVFKKKEAITVCDVHNDSRFEGFSYPVSRILVVPLLVEDQVIGTIVASDKLDGKEFYSTEIKLITSIASACAVSIKKALLFDEIHDMLFSTAEAFSLAMEAKDQYTYGHSKRVSDISALIAKEVGLPVDKINSVRLAALLHDIGKIGTPEVILDKGTPLNLEEMERMKEHPCVGARMVENIRRLREIARWICHHHERYDGSGYPSGLKGDEIPLPSRIIAIADFYDAMISERPYRKALSKEEAIKTMQPAVGSHLDPVLFEKFKQALGLA